MMVKTFFLCDVLIYLKLQKGDKGDGTHTKR